VANLKCKIVSDVCTEVMLYLMTKNIFIKIVTYDFTHVVISSEASTSLRCRAPLVSLSTYSVNFIQVRISL